MNTNFLRDMKWTPIAILKAAGYILLAIIIVAVALRMLAPIFTSLERGARGIGLSVPGSAPAVSEEAAYYKGEGYGASHNATYDYSDGDATTLSLRNIGSMPPTQSGGSIGAGAEDFEVTEYYASIETRTGEEVCARITDLKAREDVIFESANKHDRGCNYTFKVTHESVPLVLALLEELDPRDLSETTYTIQREISDFTSEEEILEAKLASINETLTSALRAYDDITRLATRTENAEALAKIIDSKIGIIERLTQERIKVTAQLERMARSKDAALDRLMYTYFSVNVYESKFIDGEYLIDSWKGALKNFVRDLNQVAQDVTINLILLIILIAQYALYLGLALVAVKYAWRGAKYVWQK